jgi:hypothetical protein
MYFFRNIHFFSTERITKKDCTTSHSTFDNEDELRQLRMRSLQDIYEPTSEEHDVSLRKC